MFVDASALVAALRLPPATTVDLEPLGEGDTSPIRATLCPPGAEPLAVFVRPEWDAERAQNNAAVLEALMAANFRHAPRLLAFADGFTAEEWVEGATPLALVPPSTALEATVDAIAALHRLPLKEGLRWELAPADLVPEELPLHRLGFADFEREPARGPLREAREALLAAPFGFTHGHLTARHVLLGPQGVKLTGFGSAGFGLQLFDLAAFLATAGLEPAQRRALALRYAAAMGLDPEPTADLADLAAIPWGILELLELPRRLIEAMGDDHAIESLRLMARRIESSLRNPAGHHPAALAIRASLWPS